MLAGIGVIGLWIAAHRPRIGWWFNIAAQVVWIGYAVTTQQWGFLIAAAAYAVAYSRLLYYAARSPIPQPSDKKKELSVTDDDDNDLSIVLQYDPESGTWDAQARRDDSVEYDTGPARPRSPEAALMVLALTLYKELGDE